MCVCVYICIYVFIYQYVHVEDNYQMFKYYLIVRNSIFSLYFFDSLLIRIILHFIFHQSLQELLLPKAIK